MEWLPCPRCGLRPLVWEFDNGRSTACGCGTDGYCHWSVRAESIMSVIKRYEEIITIKAMSKEYKAIKNYIHNELGLTIEQLIEIMVDNKLSNKDFNIIPRTVEKTSKDKMLNDIEIVIINKNLNDRRYGG